MKKIEKQRDELWGLERWPGSDAFGEVVCPVIVLWDGPSMSQAMAVAEHNTRVEVIAMVEPAKSIRWYYVQPERGEWVGRLTRLMMKIRRKPIGGWVNAKFLLGRGAGNLTPNATA